MEFVQKNQEEPMMCIHPKCDTLIAPGQGTVCPDHEEWFGEELGIMNAGIPSCNEEEVDETVLADHIGGTG